MRTFVVTLRTTTALLAAGLLLHGCGEEDEQQRPPDAYYAARQARLPTNHGLFDLLANAYAGGADDVRVTDDGTLEYPIQLRIDDDRAMQDEEVGYDVSDFVHEGI